MFTFLSGYLINFDKKNWDFATNSNFLIHVSLQPDGVNLQYFKLSLCDIKEFIVWNIKGLRNWIAQILGWEIRVCGKNSVPLNDNRTVRLKIYEYECYFAQNFILLYFYWFQQQEIFSHWVKDMIPNSIHSLTQETTNLSYILSHQRRQDYCNPFYNDRIKNSKIFSLLNFETNMSEILIQRFSLSMACTTEEI